jgi:transposase-like protein
MLEEELDDVLARPRYGRRKAGCDDEPKPLVGCRHGHRERTLTGTFGKTRICVPRARLLGDDGKTDEWRSRSLRAYQRRTNAADALIAGAYLGGTNTRRVRRALSSIFKGAVGKDVVSRAWRKTKGDFDAWNACLLGEESIVRRVLDGTVVRVRLDKKATSISLLVALDVRADGQKVLLAVKNTGNERPYCERDISAIRRSAGGRSPACTKASAARHFLSLVVRNVGQLASKTIAKLS